MHDDLPHFLRFARALALVGSVTAAGCSSTVAGQDVPAADGVTASPDTPPPGIAVAPDVPGDKSVMIDAGIAVFPDAPPGLADAPEAPDDEGTAVVPDGLAPGISVAPDAGAEPDVFVGADAAPSFGALEALASGDGLA